MAQELTQASLKDMVDDLMAFLAALDTVIPDKIDPELINFLSGVQSQPWLIELLLNAICNAKIIQQAGKQQAGLRR